MQGLPEGTQGSSIACGMHSFGRVARSSIVTLTRTTNPSISLAACPACQRAGSEMQGLPQLRAPLVKLLVGFHSLHGMHSFGQWRDRKSIVTLTRTTNPSISLAPCQAGGEMQGLPATEGPLVKLLERIP
jgi:hypothetical protein